MKLQNNENLWKSSVNYRDNWKYQFSDYLDFPRVIHFETHSYCNAACVMCPYAEVSKIYDNGFMDDKLIDKIINECQAFGQNIEYEFLPYLMNEPSLDKRLPDIIKKIKRNLPLSAVSIYTNGALCDARFWDSIVNAEPDSIVFSVNSLDEDEYKRITGRLKLGDFLKNIMYVKEEIIKNGKNIEIIAHVLRMGKDIKELLQIMQYWKERDIACRTAYVENRAGDIDIDSLTEDYNFLAPNKCWRVLTQIHILYDGRVVLCCGDWHRSVILGDIKKQSIHDIWNQKEYIAIRKAHRTVCYKNMPSLCLSCNMIGSK